MVSSTDVKTDTHLRVLSTSKMTNIPPKQFASILAQCKHRVIQIPLKNVLWDIEIKLVQYWISHKIII